MMVKHALKVLKHVTPLVPIFAQMEVTLWTCLIGFIVSRWILFYFLVKYKVTTLSWEKLYSSVHKVLNKNILSSKILIIVIIFYGILPNILGLLDSPLKTQYSLLI